MSVLDALRWIRTHLDSSLAIRYSCINANACKTCMALVNGEVEYTCIAKLTPGVVTVEPLPKRPLIRDLVTDIIPEDEKLCRNLAHIDVTVRRSDSEASRERGFRSDAERPKVYRRCCIGAQAVDRWIMLWTSTDKNDR